MCSNFSTYITKDIEGGKLDDDNHASTCLLGRGFWVINTNTYECNASGLSNQLVPLNLHNVDAVTAETTGEDWDLILNINQGIHNLAWNVDINDQFKRLQKVLSVTA